MSTRRYAVALGAAIVLPLGACGAGEELTDTLESVVATSEAAPAAGSAGEGEGDEGDGSQDSAEPLVIDPAQMPADDTIEVEVDGQNFTFTQADSDVEWDCDLTEDRFELVARMQGHGMQLEFMDQVRIGGEPGTWRGTGAVAPRELEDQSVGAAYLPAAEEHRVAVTPPHVLLVGRFTFRPTSTAIQAEDVGTGTVRATCADPDAAASDSSTTAGAGTATTSGGAGVANADGTVVAITVGDRTWDFGPIYDDIVCTDNLGFVTAFASGEAPGGGSLGFEVVLNVDGDDIQAQEPYVRLLDDGAGAGYVVGVVPGVDGDPGASAIHDVIRTEGTTFALVEFVTSDAPDEPVPGSVQVSCGGGG